jgi:hypothetical protein
MCWWAAAMRFAAAVWGGNRGVGDVIGDRFVWWRAGRLRRLDWTYGDCISDELMFERRNPAVTPLPGDDDHVGV